MSALRILARGLMNLAVALAPKTRADWRRAMQSEFEVVTQGVSALEWALGCAATAAGWRLRADAGYLLAFVAAIATAVWFRDHWQDYVRTDSSWNLHSWDNTMVIAGLALPVCVLAAVRRRPTPYAGWLLVIAAGVALSALGHGHWQEIMRSTVTRSLPVWAATTLVLKLALPGAILAAICWRLRADTAYVTVLVALIVIGHWLDHGLWTAVSSPTREQFFALAAASPYVALALPCLLLCAARPDRLLVTMFATLLVNADLAGGIATSILPLLADPLRSTGNHPHAPNLVMALIFGQSMFGAALIGGAAGWTMGRIRQRPGRRIATS